MPFSVHTQRWVKAVSELELDLHFFSSFKYARATFVNPNLNYHDFSDTKRYNEHQYFHSLDDIPKWLIRISFLSRIWGKLRRKLYKKEYSYFLKKCINKIGPDIVHTLESQHAGYLLLEAIEQQGLKKNFLWIHSTWGIDLHYFGEIQKHKPKLKSLFSNIDLYCPEGKRDIRLAQNFGYRGTTQVFPSVGGFYEISTYRKPPSNRSVILVKGYQDSVRRGLNAIKAIVESIGSKNYKVLIYGASPEVRDYVVNQNLGYLEILSNLSHEEMIKLTKKAILSITNNLSDGLPNSFIEAMACGAFPIQSNTSMADEWIVHEKTGMLVDPENVYGIAKAIDFALTNPELIDIAAEQNRIKFEKSFNKEEILSKMRDLYLHKNY